MNAADASIRIRQGELLEREHLEELQRRASLSNSGDAPRLIEHPEAIELPSWQLASGRVTVAESATCTLGFGVSLAPVRGAAELAGIFVEPTWWRQGVGRHLMQACIARARSEAAGLIAVVVNGHAEPFYKACGFAVTGTTTTHFGPAFLMSLAL